MYYAIDVHSVELYRQVLGIEHVSAPSKASKPDDYMTKTETWRLNTINALCGFNKKGARGAHFNYRAVEPP